MTFIHLFNNDCQTPSLHPLFSRPDILRRLFCIPVSHRKIYLLSPSIYLTVVVSSVRVFVRHNESLSSCFCPSVRSISLPSETRKRHKSMKPSQDVRVSECASAENDAADSGAIGDAMILISVIRDELPTYARTHRYHISEDT